MKQNHVLTYLQWCIGKHNHHGKDEEPCMKMTAFVSRSHAVEFYNQTVFWRVGRHEGRGDREYSPKDSSLSNFLHSHHKLFFSKLKSQIFKVGRLHSAYSDSDWSRGTNWQQIPKGKFPLLFHWEFKPPNSHPSTSKLVWILSSISKRTNLGTT